MNNTADTSESSLDTLLKLDTDALHKALSQVKYRIITAHNNAFLSTMLLNLKHIFSRDVPTAATNGLEIIYNPLFFMNLDVQERVGLVCHEIWHVAFSHMSRRGNRNPVIFNMAGDYVINQMLIKDGYKLPEGALYDPSYKGMSTEEVYTKLIDENVPEDSFNTDLVYTTGTDADADTDLKIKEMVIKATEIARMTDSYSNIPGEIIRAIDDLINPKLDWRGLLIRYINDHTKDDYSWKRPNKRFMPDFYLPSNFSESINNITIALDTSGSISNEEVSNFLSECLGIITTFSVNQIKVIDCDCEINSITIMDSPEDVKNFKPKGGGGTAFKPVFDHCDEEVPTILIYFTDLYGNQITEEREYPVIWICHSTHSPAPIGETYYYEYDH